MKKIRTLWKDIRPTGIVFGDIGTSPIYTLAITFSFIEKTEESIKGVLSLIFWALIIVPTLQYAFLAMNLSLRGEGGQIVLLQILMSKVKEKKVASLFLLLSFVAISFFIGEATITPSISIVSAYEGLHLIYDITQEQVILLSVVTAFFLFSLQKGGASKISFLFTPIMMVWFTFLFFFGLVYILKKPKVITYINPYYAIEFALNHPREAFLSLAGVILCITGSEAFYTDIGHLGRDHIRRSWLFIVLPALVVSYFGQGAFLLLYGGDSPFFEHIKKLSEAIYLPAVILTTSATVIASQAVISGLFSVFYQGINVGIFPRLKVEHRSGEFHGQIYIGFINWLAFLFVVFIINFFKSSERIGHAYGFAVNVVMVIGAFFLAVVYAYRKSIYSFLLVILVILFDVALLSSNVYKIKEGGYISVAIATLPFITLVVFKIGQQSVYAVLKAVSFNDFFEEYKRAYKHMSKIPGCAIFLVRDTKKIPPYVMTIIRDMGIIYEENILMTISQMFGPFGLEYAVYDQGYNLKIVKIDMGYMEVINMNEIFDKLSIKPRAIFYGIEDIITTNPILKIYSVIKKVAPSFESFYNFPTSNIHGVITKVRV